MTESRVPATLDEQLAAYREHLKTWEPTPEAIAACARIGKLLASALPADEVKS